MKSNNIEGWDTLHHNQQKLYELLLKADEDDRLTLDDMREALGANSINTVVYHLNQLEKKGYVMRNEDSGQIKVLSAPVKDIVYLNLYATAGCSPTGFFNDENVKERIPFPARQLRVNNDSFLVQADGDSMEPMIHSGDLVLADRSPVSNGDVAVVVHNGEAKIKKVFKGEDEAILQSLNPKYEPVLVDNDELHGVGVVRGVVRNFNTTSKVKKSRS